MSFGWLPLAAIALIAVAAVAEIILRRGKKRPLSRHAVRQRRWEDDDQTKDNLHIITTSWTNSETGERIEKTWNVSRNPHDQAKALMPGRA